MLGAFKSAVDVALQGQGTRLIQAAESYKDRAIDQMRRQAIDAGVMAALAIVGLVFMLAAIGIGLGALYYVVAQTHGKLAGLGAAGGAALFLSLVMFTVIALRGKKSGSHSMPQYPPARAETLASLRARDAWGAYATADAVALGQRSVDAATGIVRNGSREAVLATLAATVIIGMLVGRRR